MTQILKAAVIALMGGMLWMLPTLSLAQLPTQPGFEAGGQFSRYWYAEPVAPPILIWGKKTAITGAYTFTKDEWFVKGDARYAYGKLQYASIYSGTKKSIPDCSTEVRLIAGRDFFASDSISVSPYAGVAYRNLFNDLRGLTSTGAIGYRRYSQYWYIPVGLTSRIGVTDTWLIIPTLEYDYLINGQQDTKLSDTNLGFTDVRNKQKEGFGVRGSVMLEKGNEKGSWSFGPWLHVWKIKKTDPAPIGMNFIAWEPNNKTVEVGLEVRYRF